MFSGFRVWGQRSRLSCSGLAASPRRRIFTGSWSGPWSRGARTRSPSLLQMTWQMRLWRLLRTRRPGEVTCHSPSQQTSRRCSRNWCGSCGHVTPVTGWGYRVDAVIIIIILITVIIIRMWWPDPEYWDLRDESRRKIYNFVLIPMLRLGFTINST